ncbi:MAG: ergothioneine biosynthesis protein EgtB [Candidatus Eisenbacteria bacterium]|nr:ergothioneine biosynthesis protein EgtB [Candidatus Eisenbacteria bacterium]
MSGSARAHPEERVDALLDLYRETRAWTERLCRPLAIEDYVVQSMPDASPAKWHLAHTSWFFETFLLLPLLDGYASPHPSYAYLFNSYYERIGSRHPRPERGLLTRPTVPDVYRYRSQVDEAMESLLGRANGDKREAIAGTVRLGIEHERQHQELILTDLKHLFSKSPLRPAYREPHALSAVKPAGGSTPAKLEWVSHPGGVVRIGHDGGGFAFDNEGPAHRVFLEPFALGSRLVTSREYLAFLEDGGYERADLWLSLGWDFVSSRGIRAPLYWERDDQGAWRQMTLNGMLPILPEEPVSHVSFFEADAFARWAGARLPTEAEWEAIAAPLRPAGNFLEDDQLRPLPAPAASPIRSGAEPVQMFGDLWEWTSSAYSPYPGFRASPDAVGEYNGKFMCNQYVLRGGSCVTPRDHIRATYRNFFPPEARWQFTGIRLATESR